MVILFLNRITKAENAHCRAQINLGLTEYTCALYYNLLDSCGKNLSFIKAYYISITKKNKPAILINSFPASGDFCRLLITFADS